jgi:glycosyltransferase involved in cell wall biosynthesis
MRSRRPSVTVVIPTAGRRSTLATAVQTALSQQECNVEVHVVGDGARVDHLAVMVGGLADDRRVTLHSLPGGRGGSNAARNYGAEQARTQWVALLDDDDAWLPHKLTTQITMTPAAARRAVLSSRFVARSAERDYVWPRLLPDASNHLSEYLFCRQGLFASDGHVQTSTLVAPTALLLEHPFREDLARHQDHDWVLRCAYEAGAQIVMAPDALSVYALPGGRSAAIGGRGCWQERWEWASTSRHLFTERAYAGFLLSYGVFAATLDGDRRAIPFLVREAFAGGRPRLRDLALAATLATVPAPARRRIRASVSRTPAAPPPARSR